LKPIRPKRVRGQSWKIFLHTHAAEGWACDFLQVTDLFFRPLFAFFLIELKSRRVIHIHKGKVKEKGNRVDANDEFVNGCTNWLEPYRKLWVDRLDALERHLNEKKEE
jgi:hypothetical protein